MWELNNFKNNIAIIKENGDKITYEQFDNYCNDLTANINKRCLVFNMCRNEIGSIVGYIGFLNAKIVPLMLKSDLDKALLTNFLNIYKPSYINLPDDMTEGFSFEKIYSNLGYTLLKTNFEKEYQLNDDLALLLTT